VRSFTRWVLDHRRTVVVVWVAITVAAFASITPAVDALSSTFELPGRESTEAADRIEERYGNGGNRVSGPLVAVVELPEGTTIDSPGVRAEAAAAFRAIAEAVPGSRSADLASTGDRVFVSDDGSATYGVIWFPPSPIAFDPAGEAAERARGAAEGVTVAGAPVIVTGLDSLASGEGGSAASGR
jgi:putative drug exporter of the RND superfamily